MVEQHIDVAGVPLSVQADDAELADLVTARWRGFAATDEPAVVAISVVREPGTTPRRQADDEFQELRFWLDESGLVASARDLVVHVTSSGAVAHVPDERSAGRLEDLTSLALAWLLAEHGRFLLHGAAIARGDDALLVVGPTGAGKSTLAAAAMETGWQVLSDDQVVVDASGPRFVVHGVHQPPSVPREIGGAVAASGVALGDPRDRAQLPRDVLARGGVTLVATVVVTHSERAGGELVRAPTSRIFPDVLQAFPGSSAARLRARFFPVAGALARQPAFVLGHARTTSRRRECAARHLGAVLDSL